MQNPVTIAVVKTGLLSSAALDELHRWGFPIEVVEEHKVIRTAEAVVGVLREAIESEDCVELRDTDLDILHRYLQGQQAGKLHLEDGVTRQKTTVPVFYVRNRFGEYIIPWSSDSIHDLLTEPGSWLKTAEGEKVVFSDTRDLFFGATKAFIVCSGETP